MRWTRTGGILAVLASLALSVSRGQLPTQPRTSDSCITAIGGLSAADSVILPAYTAQRHYLTFLSIFEWDTVAIVASTTAYDSITSTNLPGGFAWRLGNALAASATYTPISTTFPNPIVSLNASAITIIRASAPGTGGRWAITVCYYHQ